MAYDILVAERIRNYLATFQDLVIEEKVMFSGMAFMVNGKMCVNVSGDKLMCRFDPDLQEEIAERPGFQPMIMKGKELTGYCYVDQVGFKFEKEFRYWVDICLSFNERARSSKRLKKSK